MPHVAVVVQVVHGGLQRWLQGVGVILEEPENDAPHQSRKQWERISLRLRHVAFLHSQAGQGKENPRQQVHVDLAVDVVVVSKHQPTSKAGRKEGLRLQALPLDSFLQGLKPLVCEYKVGQVAGVSVRCLSNGFQFVFQASTFKQKRHHKGVGGSDFCSIYGSISESFYNGKKHLIFFLHKQIVYCV